MSCCVNILYLSSRTHFTSVFASGEYQYVSNCLPLPPLPVLYQPSYMILKVRNFPAGVMISSSHTTVAFCVVFTITPSALFISSLYSQVAQTVSGHFLQVPLASGVPI